MNFIIEPNKQLSGFQPGRIHIGNFITVLLALRKKLPTKFMIADLHRMTTTFSLGKEVVEFSSYVVALCKLVGLTDYVIYRQSMVAPTMSCFWKLACITNKSCVDKLYNTCLDPLKPQTVGVYNYPVLVAVDIFLCGVENVFVGIDQKHNLELADKILEKIGFKFQYSYSDFQLNSLKLATKKMSKTNDNAMGIIYLDEPFEATKEKILKAVTCEKGVLNLFNIAKTLGEIVNQSLLHPLEYYFEHSLELKNELVRIYGVFASTLWSLVSLEETERLLLQGEEVQNKIATKNYDAMGLFLKK